MAKVIQIQTSTVGDNVNSEVKLVTTLLYDNGDVYEGSYEVVGGNYNDGFVYDMVWHKLNLPDLNTCNKSAVG